MLTGRKGKGVTLRTTCMSQVWSNKNNCMPDLDTEEGFLDVNYFTRIHPQKNALRGTDH